MAAAYVRRHWAALNWFTEDATIPIDNNDCEQLMRRMATGRKNWMFKGSVAAGERAANLLTIIGNAIRNDLDLRAYLDDVLRRVLAGATDWSLLWVRPMQMFSETVRVDGRELPRFQPLDSSSENIGESIKNIFDDLPQHLPKEVVQTLIRAADVRIERIISHGHTSATDVWYDQPQQEWVIVLKGAARLQFEDGMVEIKVGDFINIPAFRKHRVDWTTPDEPTVWMGDGGAVW